MSINNLMKVLQPLVVAMGITFLLEALGVFKHVAEPYVLGILVMFVSSLISRHVYGEKKK